MNVENLTTPMEVEPQQISKNNHSNPTPGTNSSTINAASRLGKTSAPCVDPFAACVGVVSLEGYKNQKHMKPTISDSTQSHLCLSTEQKRGQKISICLQRKVGQNYPVLVIYR